MTRRVIIADDEPLARERIRMMLHDHPGHSVVAECGDGAAAADAVAEHAPDVLFLDVRMPGLDGFEVVAAMEAVKAPPTVIFVTAFSEHAVRAFDVGAVDYLMKPFDAARFGQALSRAEARRPSADEARAFLRDLAPRPQYPARFAVRGPKGSYFVSANDVSWVNAAENYVALHAGGRTHLVRDTLAAFAAKLVSDQFIRVHRSAIVRIDHIVRLEPQGHGCYRIVLRDGSVISSSRSYGDAVRRLRR